MDDFDDDDDFCDDGDFIDDDIEGPLEVDEDGWDESDTISDGDYDDNGGDDGFTWKDAMFIGGVLGPVYEEGLERRKLVKKRKKERE